MSSIVERDFVKRMIQQLARALAAALGFRQAGQLEAARKTLLDTCVALLGIEWSALTALDSRSAAGLLGRADKVFTLARLLEEEAELLEIEQDPLGAARYRVQALELMLEALRAAAPPDWIAHARALAARVDDALLPEMYRPALARLGEGGLAP